jgi:hypothetical protein
MCCRPSGRGRCGLSFSLRNNDSPADAGAVTVRWSAPRQQRALGLASSTVIGGGPGLGRETRRTGSRFATMLLQDFEFSTPNLAKPQRFLYPSIINSTYSTVVAASVAMDKELAIHVEHETDALHYFASSASIGKEQLFFDNLDEIRRVTDANCIASTDSQECFLWDKTALGVDGDEWASSTERKPTACSADEDPFSGDDLFEVNTECVSHYCTYGTFKSQVHNQGPNPSDGIPVVTGDTSFDLRKYRAWIGAMNLHQH